jgi:tetratricopeptide (TPR) repeat protein
MQGSPVRRPSIAGVALLGALLLGASAAPAATPEEFLWAGNVSAALESAQTEAKAHPTDIAAQELVIDILLSIGLPDRAAALGKARVDAAPTDPAAHYLLGRALVKPEDATRSYEAALRIDPNYARAHMGMGAVHLAAGRDADALAAYSRAVALDPSLAEAWVAIGRIQVVAGDSAAALATAHSALRHVANEPSLYLLAAGLDPAQADAYLLSAIAASPGDPTLHQIRGDMLLSGGDAKGALAEADRALAINPSMIDAQRTRAFAAAVAAGELEVDGVHALVAAHDSQGTEPARSRQEYSALIDRYPRSAIPLLARAQLALDSGDRGHAGPDLERALALDPDEIEIQMAYGVFQLQAGRADLARPWLARAQAERPWDPGLALALGRTLRELHETEEARRILDDAWRIHSWNPDVAIAAAQARVDAGDAESAYQLIREAVRRMRDPRLSVALVTTATAAQRYDEAAKILEDLGNQTGRQTLLDAASRLRAAQAGGSTSAKP